MAIRRAHPADFEAALTLVNRLLVELGGEPVPREAAQETFRRLTAQETDGFVLVYERDGASVGVCTVSLVQAIRASGPYMTIQEMYIVPELRSQGIGAEMVAEAVSQAGLLGCSMVELGTPMNGDRQERFYQRLGFQRVGSRLRRSL